MCHTEKNVEDTALTDSPSGNVVSVEMQSNRANIKLILAQAMLEIHLIVWG